MLCIMSFWSIIFTEASKWSFLDFEVILIMRANIKIPSKLIFEIISFINSKLSLNSEFLHRTVANKCDSIVRDVGECAKNSVLRTFVIALPHSVCQKPLLRYSQERVALLRPISWLIWQLKGRNASIVPLFDHEIHHAIVLRIAFLLFWRRTRGDLSPLIKYNLIF